MLRIIKELTVIIMNSTGGGGGNPIKSIMKEVTKPINSVAKEVGDAVGTVAQGAGDVLKTGKKAVDDTIHGAGWEAGKIMGTTQATMAAKEAERLQREQAAQLKQADIAGNRAAAASMNQDSTNIIGSDISRRRRGRGGASVGSSLAISGNTGLQG